MGVKRRAHVLWIAGALVLAGCEEKANTSATITMPHPMSAPAIVEAKSLHDGAEATHPHEHEHAADTHGAAAHHCEGSPTQCAQNAAPPLAHATADGQLYGAAQSEQLGLTPLLELMAHPEQFADKTVRTSGTIGRVCQHRGCWMELRAEQGDSVVRVPMAGHAFFVPTDASGRHATIEGAVSVREGTPNPVRIDATSVLIANR